MSKTTFLNHDLYQYVIQYSVRLSPMLMELNEQTNKTFGIPMQSSVEQLNFFAWLVQLLQPKKILEVGTYTGLSALAMAQHLPADGKIICIDHSEQFTALAKQYWQKANVMDKIELGLGDAVEQLDLLLQNDEKNFDIMFIDANKNNYQNYYEAGLQLVRQGGVIMIDNVLWKGEVINASDQRPTTEAIREFNSKLITDKRVAITLLPIGDGLTLALKK